MVFFAGIIGIDTLIDIVDRERETQAACVLAGLAVMPGRTKQVSYAFFMRVKVKLRWRHRVYI